MAQLVEDAGTFQFVGGSSCLDFLNTVSWPSLEDERLVTFDDVAQWGVRAGLLRPADRRRLGAVPARAARSELLTLRRLRSLLHALFAPVAGGRRARRDDVRAFNRALRNTLRDIQVVPRRQSFAWSPELEAADLQSIRRAVVWDAAKLLTSARLRRLRRCANPECGWLFLDESRRSNRRWCSMDECGSRAKARRYYDRVTGRSAGKRPPRRPRRRRDRP